MVAITPEKSIIGPNPLDHVPGKINAPEMGIPVNEAQPLNADINPNLLSALDPFENVPCADFLDWRNHSNTDGE